MTPSSNWAPNWLRGSIPAIRLTGRCRTSSSDFQKGAMPSDIPVCVVRSDEGLPIANALGDAGLVSSTSEDQDDQTGCRAAG